MENSESSLLLFQQYTTPEGGVKYMVWKLPAEEFEKLITEYSKVVEKVEDARRWALCHFVMQNRATLVTVTDMDAELWAANMRESGFKAKYVK